MKQNQLYILTIAGFDPTGGAGLLADIKTFEQNKCQAMAIQTANTIQTEDRFLAPNWIDKELILAQLEALFDQYTFPFIKIGLIEDLDLLQTIIGKCKEYQPDCKIIWDPILKASAGFDFKHDLTHLNQLIANCYLITPNWEEMQVLVPDTDPIKGAELLSTYTNVLLKGGHHKTDPGRDYLATKKGLKSFKAKPIKPIAKHGSGCVFSAALLANLSRGYTLQKSILRAKRYIEHFLTSHPSLLGRHRL